MRQMAAAQKIIEEKETKQWELRHIVPIHLPEGI
jgi:hypothetical protein